MFRKEEDGIWKIGGRYLEKRRVLFRKDKGGVQKRGGWCSENCEPVVFTKCGGNTWGVSTYSGGSRYG